MEELELWASISDTITILYDELTDAEFEYGAFSPQYNEIADKIKLLREASHLTQTELAKKLNITRSSVNAWEMGISVPSTTYLIELALLFHVSTDFLLGLEQNNTIDISTLSEREAILVYELVDYFTSQKKDVVD